jgi:hypothetical protein
VSRRSNRCPRNRILERDLPNQTFEVDHLLARAGFTVDCVYSGFDRSACGSQYPGELIFVSRRQL